MVWFPASLAARRARPRRHEALVERPKTLGRLRPGEVPQREAPAGGADPAALLLVVYQWLQLAGNLEGVAFLEEDALLAVRQIPPDVRARQQDRPAGGKELGQLGREPVVVERVRPARLHQDVRERENRR